MRKVVVAESLLSLVMPPDRAAATAGDLLESSRGPSHFCWSVLGAATGAIRAQFSLSTAIVAVGVSTAANLILATLFTAFLVNVNPPVLSLGLPDVGFLLLTPMLGGYLMARSLPNREMGGWIAVTLFMMCGACSSFWISTGIVRLIIPWILIPPEALALLLPGVLIARRHTLCRQARVSHA